MFWGEGQAMDSVRRSAGGAVALQYRRWTLLNITEWFPSQERRFTAHMLINGLPFTAARPDLHHNGRTGRKVNAGQQGSQ